MPSGARALLRGASQKVASAVLPFLAEERDGGGVSAEGSSPASRLLSFFDSHEARERALRRLNNSAMPADPEVVRLTLAERRRLVRFAPGPPRAKPRDGDDDGNGDGDVRAVLYAAPCPSSSRSRAKRRPRRRALQVSGAQNPPTATEREDLSQWTKVLFSLVATRSNVAPSPWLRNAAGWDWRADVWPVLNYFLSMAVREGPQPESSACSIDDDGDCRVAPGSSDVAPAAALQLYYFALEALLRAPSPEEEPAALDLDGPRGHGALFSLCHFCLHRARRPEGRRFLIADSGACPVAFHRLAGAFVRALRPDGKAVKENRVLALPSYLVRIVQQLQNMLLDMVWSDHGRDGNGGDSFVDRVKMMSPCDWCKIGAENAEQGSSREHQHVDYVMHHLPNVIHGRVHALCSLLKIPQASAVTGKTMEIFATMLRHRTSLFFDRHPDQLMLCSLYTALSVERKCAFFSFQQITDTYMDMNRDIFGEEISHDIVYRVRICPDRHEVGDIVSLFNEVFVPNVTHFWQSFKHPRQEHPN